MNEAAKEENGAGLEVVRYDLNIAKIHEIGKKSENLEIQPGDKGDYDLVKKALGVHRGMRLKIDATKKLLSEKANKYLTDVRGKAKELHEVNDPYESALKATRATEDDRVAEIETKRVQGIREKITAIERLDYDLSKKTAVELETLNAVLQHTPIEKEDYQEFVGEAMANLHNITIKVKEAWDYRVKRDEEEEAQIAEEVRLIKIRDQQKAEAARLDKVREDQANEKLIADGIRQQEQEAKKALDEAFEAQKDWFRKRIKGNSFQTPDVDSIETAIEVLQSIIAPAAHKPAIQLLLDEQMTEAQGILRFRKQQEALAEEKRKLQAGQDALEAEKKAEKDKQDRVELGKKMEAEALERAEQEIVGQETKITAMGVKSDREKVLAFADVLEGITPPKVKDEEIAKILFYAQKGLAEVIRKIIKDLETL